VPGITFAFILKSIISFVISFALQSLTKALFGKQAAPEDFDFKRAERIVRSPISPRRVIYGEKLVSGPLVFASSTSNDTLLHMVVVHAAHECHGITDAYISDERIPPRNFAGDAVTNGQYKSHATWTRHLGSRNQAADPSLVADIPEWTTAHRLRGLCYTRWKLKSNEDLFPAGIPNLRALVRGRLIWDPRETGIAILSSTFLTAGQVEIETAVNHNKSNGDIVFISGHASESENRIFGEYEIISITGDAHFVIEQDTSTVTGVGTGGVFNEMKFSQNPVLCVLDYLVNRSFGRAAPESVLDLPQIIAAANTCDEQVELTEVTENFTVQVLAGAADVFTRSTTFSLNTGGIVRVSSDGALPAPLLANTDYYYINLGVKPEFALASTLDDAVRHVAIDIADTGSGTHTITRKSQVRYTCNGAFTIDAQPIDILGDMLTSCAGTIVAVQGKFNIFVAEPSPVVHTLGVEDLRGTLSIEADPDRQAIFNGVVGTFISPDNFWQAANFPPVSRSQFVIDDGAEINRDIELRFTNDVTEAQRISTIHLLQSRVGMVVLAPTNLTAMLVKPWDVIAFNNTVAGWASKEFRVMGWQLTPVGKGMGLDLDLQEYDGDVFSWQRGDAKIIAEPPAVTLPPFAGPINRDPTFNGDATAAAASCVVDGVRDDFSNENAVDSVTSVNNNFDSAGQFYSSDAVDDMTLAGLTICPAVDQPVQARLWILEADIDPIALGTDIKAFISRDGGVTFTEVTLTDEGDFDSTITATLGRRILSGQANLSSQSSGTSMSWKITTHNLTQLEIHAINLFWR
jgi:hypothetical protein